MARRRQTSKKSHYRPSPRRGKATRPPLHRIKASAVKKYSPSSRAALPRAATVPKPRYRRLTVTRNAAPLSPPSSLSPSTFYSGGILETTRTTMPRRVSTCKARRVRREVIFAQGLGGTRVSRPVFTPNSKVRC